MPSNAAQSPDDVSAYASVRDSVVYFVLAFALAALATAIDGWPLPRVFDEFAYILSGETFAAGRLTNPPHPLPQFFETIHVLQEPTYSAKYFPAQGLFLALGLVLADSARVGQWISFALMGGALVWMLRGWTSRRAALIGAALAILLFADTHWPTGYWGSALAVAGSALIFGALPRMRRAPSVGIGITLGMGVVILALSRPFEGLLLSVAPALATLAWLIRGEGDWRPRWSRVALPALATIGAGGALLAAHNRATTGDPLRPAYVAYESKAPGAPPFVWQRPVVPAAPLRPPQRARFRVDMAAYTQLRTRPLRELATRFGTVVRFYLPSAAFAVLLFLPLLALGDRNARVATWSVATVTAGTAVSSYFLASYVAPALPPLLLLTVLGAKRLAARGVTARRFAAALGIALLLGGAWRFGTESRDELEARRPNAWERYRARLEARVREVPGRHLVFVSYADTYRSQHEFVQNGADRAGADVLWAHDLGPTENQRLIAHERGRQAWSLRVDIGANGNRTVLQPLGERETAP